MPTVVKLGPADHGRPLEWEEFLAGEYEEGHKYELIDGRLYVSPQANLPADSLERWMARLLERYAEEHPEVINYVTPKARVFVPGSTTVEAPEPDIAAYHDFPLERRFEIEWRDVSPLLVVEVLSEDDPDKDLVRNARLYRRVPSIREFSALDPRGNAALPRLRVHRRSGTRWRITDYEPGETYRPRLLPGFALLLDPLGG